MEQDLQKFAPWWALVSCGCDREQREHPALLAQLTAEQQVLLRVHLQSCLSASWEENVTESRNWIPLALSQVLLQALLGPLWVEDA